MATIFKCDNCGKEAKHGDEWLNVRVTQQSIRDERYYEYEQDSITEPGYSRRPVLVCSATCAFAMILKQAKKVAKLMEDIISVAEGESALDLGHNYYGADDLFTDQDKHKEGLEK